MRTLQCPICGSRWKVETNGNGVQETMWITCAPCEEALPQMVHESDAITDEELNPDERDEDPAG